MSNSHLNTNFLNLARELDIMEPKTPEDVYKTHLDSVRPFGGGSSVDSARQNLVSNCSLPGVGREVVVVVDSWKSHSFHIFVAQFVAKILLQLFLLSSFQGTCLCFV